MIKLIHGDNKPFLLNPDKIDAVITDPPWNMGYFENDEKTWQEYAKWLDKYKSNFELICETIIIFQSSKAIPFVSHLFDDYEPFVSIKNFSQMTKHKMPNCFDIVFMKYKKYLSNGRNWFIANTAGMKKERVAHPTQRTLDVMEYIIKMFDCDTILDPFMGSGTTGVACVKLNRNFIGIEKEKKYYDIAVKRIQDAGGNVIHSDYTKSGADIV